MTKHGFHRGVRLHREILRETRLAQGLRQTQLAKQAGVGERTVRKAESGQVIEKHIADYICTALHLSLEDTMLAVATKRRTQSDRMRARRFERDLQAAVLDSDPEPFLDWLHPEVQWRCISSDEPNMNETILGREAAMQRLQRIHHWLETKGVYKRTVAITQMLSSGDILYIYSDIRLAIQEEGKSPRDASKKSLLYWSAKLLQFDDSLVRNFEHFWGSGSVSNSLSESLDHRTPNRRHDDPHIAFP